MAKIGTAHIEVKPVVDEVALEVIVERIAEAVAEGVERGMRQANRSDKPRRDGAKVFAWKNGQRVEVGGDL